MLTDSVPEKENVEHEMLGEYCPKEGMKKKRKEKRIACGECSVCCVAKIMGIRPRWEICIIANPIE